MLCDHKRANENHLPLFVTALSLYRGGFVVGGNKPLGRSECWQLIAGPSLQSGVRYLAEGHFNMQLSSTITSRPAPPTELQPLMKTCLIKILCTFILIPVVLIKKLSLRVNVHVTFHPESYNSVH